MWLLYLSCLLPVIVGTALFVLSKRVHWGEWIAGSAISFLVAAGCHAISFSSQTADFETWSGRIEKAVQHSAWQEYYEEAIYRTEYYYETEYYTDEKGRMKSRRVQRSRQVFDHWEPRTRWHSESFECFSNISSTHGINRPKYELWVKEWGNQTSYCGNRTTWEHNSRQIGGDPNDYATACPESITEPVHLTKSVVNRLKAAQSVFNFAKVPDEVKPLLFSYPESESVFVSNRVMGTARNTITRKLWDSVNARLGPTKKVNLIICGFDSSDHTLAEFQRSLWIGGKKNDLVLCYGKGWSKCFGWSDSDILKRDLEEILRKKTPSDKTLPQIEKAVAEGYDKTDWHKFDHLSIEPNSSTWVWFWALTILSQGALWFFFHTNQIDKTA